jgi:hypothetical protein
MLPESMPTLLLFGTEHRPKDAFAAFSSLASQLLATISVDWANFVTSAALV